MADQIVLTADTRPGDGKGEARALRGQGRVPAVAYGSGLDAVPVHVDARELRHALATDAGENAVLRLDIAGDTHLAMAREIYRHPVRRHIMHLDFVTFDRNQVVTVDVPIVVEGDVEGAIVSQPLNALTIEVLPLEVPSQIDVSVEGMEVGDVLRAGDLTLPDGVTLLTDEDRTVVSITVPTEEPVEGEESEGAEGEGAEAEGEGAEAAEGDDAE